MSLSAVMFQRIAKKNDAKRDAGLTTPENITRFDNIAYGPDPAIQYLDVYMPKGTDRKLPVIASIHGGGYVYGDVALYQHYCMRLAQRGFTVVNFNYHLAPKYKFPTPLVDTNLVMDWVCAHADEYFMDVNNVFMVGDSAGAQLCSQYATICSNPAYADVMDIHPGNFKLKGVGLNCGMYDLIKVVTTKSSTSALMFDYFTREWQQFGEKMKVLDYITSEYPATYLLSAEGDFLKEYCKPMYDLLTSKGVVCEYKIYGDKDTGHVFHCDCRSELAAEANDDETNFMKRFVEE